MMRWHLIVLAVGLMSGTVNSAEQSKDTEVQDTLTLTLEELDMTLSDDERQGSVRMELQPQAINRFQNLPPKRSRGIRLDEGLVTYGDKLSFSYNPMWASFITGHDVYEGKRQTSLGKLLKREVIFNYQLTPQLKLRYHADWSKEQGIRNSGKHSMELKYRF